MVVFRSNWNFFVSSVAKPFVEEDFVPCVTPSEWVVFLKEPRERSVPYHSEDHVVRTLCKWFIRVTLCFIEHDSCLSTRVWSNFLIDPCWCSVGDKSHGILCLRWHFSLVFISDGFVARVTETVSKWKKITPEDLKRMWMHSFHIGW